MELFGSGWFDEDSIKRRDKAALIAYIAKLEAEYEEAQSVADAAELKFKHEKASHASDMAEAIKREDRLKKVVVIEKECVKNIEKSLHEMRAEYAEVEIAAESKLMCLLKELTRLVRLYELRDH